MALKVIIVGGVAGGARAASRLLPHHMGGVIPEKNVERRKRIDRKALRLNFGGL